MRIPQMKLKNLQMLLMIFAVQMMVMVGPLRESILSDLAVRFKQHNGLLSMPEEGCKYAYIQEYFNSHDKLGYTMFVQSPLSQPMVHRNRELFQKMASEHNSTIQDYVSDQGIADIKRVEGILIEAYNKYYGRFPTWNKVGGSIAGQKRVMPNNIRAYLKTPNDCAILPKAR